MQKNATLKHTLIQSFLPNASLKTQKKVEKTKTKFHALQT